MFRVLRFCVHFLVIAAACTAGYADSTTATRISPTIYTLGAPLSDPNCVGVDDAGQLYVMDHARQALMKFSLTGRLDRMWPEYPGCPVNGYAGNRPPDMAVISEDRVIFGAMPPWSGGIVRVEPSDRMLKRDVDDAKWRRDSWSYMQYSQVAFESDGGFYAADQRSPSPDPKAPKFKNVRHFGPSGEVKGDWSTDGDIYAISVGPEGNLYCCIIGKPSIEVYSPDGKPVRSIGVGYIDPDDKTLLPEHLAVDTNGDIYFILAHSGRIARVDRNGNLLARWGAYSSPGAGARRLQDICVRNGVIYALIYDYDGGHEIQCFSPDGTCVARYVSPKREIDMPSSIAVQADGSFAVIENAKHNTLYMDTTGKLIESAPKRAANGTDLCVVARPGGGYYVAHGYGIHSVDSSGNVTGILCTILPWEKSEISRGAHAVAVDPVSGNLWANLMDISDHPRPGFAKISPDGKMLREPSERQNPPDGLTFAMCVDSSGMILYPDERSETVRRVDAEGGILTTYGRKGTGFGELSNPQCVVLDSQGRVYVADTGNSRVQVFTSDGKPLGTWTGRLDRPCGLTVSPSNELWISDTFNDRIVRVPIPKLLAELNTKVEPLPAIEVHKKEATPAPGQVTVTGVVIAGSEDLTDCVYLESPDRSWGMKVVLPDGASVRRGETCLVRGVLELKDRSSRYPKASGVEHLSKEKTEIPPLGMANLYVGDGYWAGKKVGLSNLGMLIRTWGRVTVVDRLRGVFIIDDGSGPGDGSGLVIDVRNMKTEFKNWPAVGQYIAVTAVSTTYKTDAGDYVSAARMRAADFEVIGVKQ